MYALLVLFFVILFIPLFVLYCSFHYCVILFITLFVLYCSFHRLCYTVHSMFVLYCSFHCLCYTVHSIVCVILFIPVFVYILFMPVFVLLCSKSFVKEREIKNRYKTITNVCILSLSIMLLNEIKNKWRIVPMVNNIYIPSTLSSVAIVFYFNKQTVRKRFAIIISRFVFRY